MENRWKEVWSSKGRDFEPGHANEDAFSIYKELKRVDGFDVSVENAHEYYRAFYESDKELWNHVKEKIGDFSAFEVGCGSGANLYLLKDMGIKKIGGIDYSNQLVSIAKQITGNSHDIEVCEATMLDTNNKYDVVFSEGVFPYFTNIEYGMDVLDKMYNKAKKLVIVQEVFDKEKEAECMKKRREMYKDYDLRYDGLDKLFYPKKVFEEFAAAHQCKFLFTGVKNKYYWNSEFLYNFFMIKN